MIKGRDFYQAAAPAGWTLPDEVEVPGVGSLSGTKARIYVLLLETSRRQHRWDVGRQLGPPGAVPTWVLREPWAGGSAGDRRLRELKERGVPIECEVFTSDGEGSSTWLWRLATTDAAGTLPLQASKPPAKDFGAAVGLCFRIICGVEELDPNAVSFDLRAAGTLSPQPATTAHEYREHLLAAWRNGRLATELRGLLRVNFVLGAGQEALAEVLRQALVALGGRPV